ncbi:hypothetical protein MHBO_002666 [Bonamia ostreae]|uniref:FATC domain-containing protein n=1 Tax=Bonamia ostreae TaxID=126728 RepID=A0ABV2AN52_9EUKA
MSLLPIASRRAKSSEKDSCEINLMALKIMKRISAKLSGTEFGEFMNEKQQVNELILQATSVKNLSQCYVGWCPFW